jgi:hypothetical protein
MGTMISERGAQAEEREIESANFLRWIRFRSGYRSQVWQSRHDRPICMWHFVRTIYLVKGLFLNASLKKFKRGLCGLLFQLASRDGTNEPKTHFHWGM